MLLDSIPFFERLDGAESVLLAGAGGGFDVFSGLPLYFALRRRGVAVHLANLSFSSLPRHDVSLRGGDEFALCRVTRTTRGSGDYFPERYLSEWFHEVFGEQVPVWAFPKVGVQPLRRAYEHVLRETRADAVVLVDGGTDSLLRGDESGLGTPTEDMASIAAVHGLDVGRKLLVSVGFGVDSFHGVAHAEVLEGIAAIDRAGGYLGAFPLLRAMPEVERYREACEFVFERMPTRPSIVNLSILSAIEGQFGDHHRTSRTHGSELFINPLMSLVFAFELAPLAERLLYFEELERTETISDVVVLIEAVRRERGKKPRPRLPM